MKNCHKATAGASNICSEPNTTQHVLVLNIDETQILLQCSTICSLPIDSLYTEFSPYKKAEMENEGPGQVQVQKKHLTQGFGKAPQVFLGLGRSASYLRRLTQLLREPKVGGCRVLIHLYLRTYVNAI